MKITTDDSFEQHDSHTSYDSEVQEAYKLANSITMGHLTRKLQGDPTADLSSVLQQQASSYPELRESLAQEALETVAVSTRNEDEETAAAGSQGCLTDDAIEITHPLHEEVIAFAGLKGPVTGDAVVPLILPKLHELMRTGETLFSLHDTTVLGLDPTKVVKIGTSLNPEGITNLQFVNSHLPQIPSPKFLGSLMSRQRVYIFMSRGEGVTLESLWPQLRDAEKRTVQTQLSDIFRALRAAAPPCGNDCSPPRIGGLVSGLCQDMRRWPRTCQGLASEAEFNDFLCRAPDSRRTQTPWIKMIRSFMNDDHKLVMTHGDLHPRNIMVKWEHLGASQQGVEEDEGGNGMNGIRITSILDWEMAGWYPEYWEFVKALQTAESRGSLADWCDYLPTEAIGQWPTEYSIDLLISRWLG